MSKVVAPLQSFSASGKIGKSLVFFSHLGRNVVRVLVSPSNPMTAAQGSVRLLLGGIGRSTKAVYKGGPFIAALKTIVASGKTWVSSYVTFATGLFANAGALHTAFEAHSKKAVFNSQAALLGLTTVTISYAGTTTSITGGEQLYCLAAYANAVNAQNPGIFGASAPWDEVLASWASSDIVAFVADITATS